ncbi:NGG1p interacting factor NIF3 [Endozoicomonas sp. OPT23]|uniref:NGG1p interacting factor NIF3 n=1 Tax=Endozoicomonas sp. OPT23 TaxID=2072845 RepID=UPI00129A1F89|nr:NGG1p interacting factor NIF3 [Endozoicomonas sp. OPT23]MRI34523.1 NGG1p interacting factor NIF3 [Endozoicomonas sp. OPT23]
MYSLVFYVPASHIETVKEAVFAAGAGHYGNYDQCCWQVSGQNQFRPLDDSQPFIGQQGTTEAVEEFRVEMICQKASIRAAIDAMIQAHPYEEPAYSYWPINPALP